MRIVHPIAVNKAYDYTVWVVQWYHSSINDADEKYRLCLKHGVGSAQQRLTDFCCYADKPARTVPAMPIRVSANFDAGNIVVSRVRSAYIRRHTTCLCGSHLTYDLYRQ